MTTEWLSHPARWVCPAAGVVMVCVGLIFGRADVALLGVPLVLIFLVARPRGRSTTSVAATADVDGVVIEPGDGVDAVRLRLVSDGHRSAELLLGGGDKQVGVTLHSVRTGPQPPLIIDWDAQGRCLLTHSGAATEKSVPRVVLPSFIPLELVPQSRRLRGLTGPSTSRRAGDGLELRDVHPMGPADSLRRIDWRVTARQPSADSIWVKGTYATGEAVAVLIVDSRDEVGSDLHTWHASVPLRVDEPTSLDLARHAAASVARKLIDAGGRVGLSDLATDRRAVTPATGRHHLSRLVYALALSAPVGPPKKRVRPPHLPAESIVYLFSTLLDDESVRLVHTLKEAGHEVLVVDTLPAIRPVAEINLQLAWRIIAAERSARLRRLAGEHVAVIRWAGAGRDLASRRFAAIERTRLGPVR